MRKKSALLLCCGANLLHCRVPYLLRFERVDNLGAYSIPSEIGLLIPSDFATQPFLAWIIHQGSSQKRKDALKGVMNTGFADPAFPFGTMSTGQVNVNAALETEQQ